MSILIKGMEMPKSCDECPLLTEDGDYNVCFVGKRRVMWEWKHDRGSEVIYPKPDWCPLIEVPEDVQPVKHGRWILHSGGVPWNVIECSECGEKWHHWQGYATPNYCSNCGARMDGET